MSEAIWSKAAELIDPRVVRDFLKANPDHIRNDPELLQALGLRIDAANVVDFGPAALTRVAAAHKREAGARKQLEATARANFAAQAQTHAAVVDILEAELLEKVADDTDHGAVIINHQDRHRQVKSHVLTPRKQQAAEHR